MFTNICNNQIAWIWTSKYCILDSRLDKGVCLLFFDDHTIGNVTFDDFHVSSTRRNVSGVETCFTTLKDFSIKLAATIWDAVTPCFTGMDVMYEVATDEPSDFEASIGNDF